MRVGVIGRGFGAQAVAPAFEATEGCEVIDVVSPRDEDAVAKLCDAVDLVSVHSPPFMHLRNVRVAVERGRAVLCDKPFGRNVEEAQAMRDLAIEAGVPHFLNFQFRYLEARQRLRDLIADGAIGKPEHVSLTMIMGFARRGKFRWNFDADLGGGWLRAHGSHWIDFARWMFGEVEDIGGQVSTLVHERPGAEGVTRQCTADDTFTLTMRTDRSVTVLMDSTMVASVNMPPSLVVYGAEGAIEEVGIGGQLVLHTKAGEEAVFTPPPDANPGFDPMKSWVAIVRDSVRDRITPSDAPTFDDGLACADLMDRVARP